jgi:ribosomal protein L7/L12
MYEMIRNVLEAVGVIESKQAMVKKKLGLVSQIKPHGPVTVVVHSLGTKHISAMSAVRQLTGLKLEEIVVLTEMLPWPLLRNVSLAFALQAQELLEVMGIEVELIGVLSENAQVTPLPKTETAASLPAAQVTLPTGDYVVWLTEIGLLEERVIEGICRITGVSREEANVLTRQLPQAILVGVDEQTAHLLQRELQMVAAVVDIERVAESEIE